MKRSSTHPTNSAKQEEIQRQRDEALALVEELRRQIEEARGAEAAAKHAQVFTEWQLNQTNRMVLDRTKERDQALEALAEARGLLEQVHAMLHSTTGPTSAELDGWLDAVSKWLRSTRRR